VPLGKANDKTFERAKENEQGGKGESLWNVGRLTSVLEHEKTNGRHCSKPDEFPQGVCDNPALPERVAPETCWGGAHAALL
jgi:hypothetical protein